MRNYICLMTLLAAVGCSTISSFQYPPVRWLKDTDEAKIAMPKVKVQRKYSNTQFGQLSEQTENLLQFTQDVASMPRGLSFTGKQEALDVNNFDEAADSSWFTNRIGRYGSFENIFKTPPNMKGKWKVLAVKEQKKGPAEFVIEDSKKDHYLIKVDDSPDWLVSGGELLGALVLSSAGYNVTENYVLEFDSKILDKDAAPKGKHRALAIKIPEGEQLGPFEYQGK